MSMKIGEKIRILRKGKGISQDALATALGVTFQAVSKWENGITTPDLGLIPPLASFFGVSIDELFDYHAWENEKHVEEIARQAGKWIRDDVQQAYLLLKEGLREFPGNETLLTVLVYALWVMPEKDEELIAACNTLIDCATNEGVRCDVLRFLAMVYHRNGKKELVRPALDRIPEFYFTKLELIAKLMPGQESLDAAQLQMNLSGRTMVEMLEIMAQRFAEQGDREKHALCTNLITGLRDVFRNNHGHILELPGYAWIDE